MINLTNRLLIVALTLTPVLNAAPQHINALFKQDTIDPEQRLPDGVTRTVPKRIAAVATTEPFETRIDPANWWVGFKDPNVELMIHDRNVRDYTVSIKHNGVKIVKTEKAENANYLFLTLNIAKTATVGDVNIILTKGSDKRTLKWKLSKRNTEGGGNKGLNTKDFVYLIMPDRFANGDPSNDSYNEMAQKGIDRRKMFFRHGGDFQGIMDKLDYLQELGVTALWLNPVQENDEPYESYHGYAMTDLYRVDRRFGGNAKYVELAEKLRAKGMKLVMDIAPNHVGHNSFFIKDLPETTWIHQFDSFTRTTYRDQVVFDPYSAQADKKRMTDGWFDMHMPDLNPEGNKHLENYIAQSYLWWLETAGVDAFRIDTYLYNDPQFMARWTAKVRSEYPKVTLFAETWVHGMTNQAYSTEGFKPKYFDSKLHGVTDFQLYFGIIEALTKQQGWTEGVMQLFQDLASDIVYKNPNQNVTFIDNHDLARFYSIVGENNDKYKSAIAWLLTCRGIPQWYYGAELGFTGFTNPDGKVRQDMPGGWKEDARSVFSATPERGDDGSVKGGRTENEKELFNFTKKLANWRKTKTCLHDGKLTHFIPIDGIYTYFRHNEKETVMVVMNTSDKPQTVDLTRFKERFQGFTRAKNVITEGVTGDLSKLEIGKFQTVVLELVK